MFECKLRTQLLTGDSEHDWRRGRAALHLEVRSGRNIEDDRLQRRQRQTSQDVTRANFLALTQDTELVGNAATSFEDFEAV